MQQGTLQMSECEACAGYNADSAKFCAHCGVLLDKGGLDRAMTHPGISRAGDRPTVEVSHTADPLVGMVVADRYKIIEQIGRGGMGAVYRVEHAQIGKLMALKLLSGELSQNTELVARFKREALMVSKLSHPNTVQVFDFGTAGSLTYLAMEYLDGEDLGRVIDLGGPLDPGRTAKIVVQICSSLAEAHDLGIVHRDLKPENIILLNGRTDDVAKVLDFGLAKLRESSELGEVTTGGAIVGTPYYMSPEQIRGEPVDHRSDIYSLGALMYKCLTSEPAFEAATPMGVLTRHLTESPSEPTLKFPALRIPPTTSRIVMRALAKDPEDRFQSVRELQQALVEDIKNAGNISGVDSLLDSRRVRDLTAMGGDVVTRGEVENYERKLKRRGQYALFAFFSVLVVFGLAGWQVYERATAVPEFDGNELEPNNAPAEATQIPFGQPVRGFIGARLDKQNSDRDFYGVSIPAGTEAVSIQTSALPNMPLCVLVFQVGQADPMGRYCTGTAGHGLEIPSLRLSPGDYLFGVIQDRDEYTVAGKPPVYENVSDSYELSIATTHLASGFEIEPNDSKKMPTELTLTKPMQGRFGWMRDVDVFCVETDSAAVVFRVTDPVSGAREPKAVLEATPIGSDGEGIPVRIHRKVPESGGEHDVVSPWQSPSVRAVDGTACMSLRLIPNPLAPLPHPKVAPASGHKYEITATSAKMESTE